MTIVQQVVMVGAAVLATMLTRFIAFIVFRPNRPTPRYILYLGRVLPPAVFALLVVFCLQDVRLWGDMDGLWWGIPRDSVAQLLGVVCTVIVHLWRRNMMLSIFVGTLCYMLAM